VDVPLLKKKYLAPDSEVVIGNELGGGVGVLVSHAEGVHVPEDDDGDGGKEEALLPGLVAASMTTAHLPGKGRSLGGDTKELLVGPCEGCHGVVATEKWSLAGGLVCAAQLTNLAMPFAFRGGRPCDFSLKKCYQA